MLSSLNSAIAQTNEIKIKFIGNCGLYLTDGNLNLYVDFPYKSGFFNYMEYEKSELDSIRENSIFLFTHKHPDHYSGRLVRKAIRKKGGQKYGKWNIKKLMAFCDTTEDFSIEVIETEHSMSFTHYSYLLTWHGKRIYFNGDSETADQILTKKNMDWAFIPLWVGVDANKQEKSIDAKMIGIYHLYPHQSTTTSTPDRIKLLYEQGQWFTIAY